MYERRLPLLLFVVILICCQPPVWADDAPLFVSSGTPRCFDQPNIRMVSESVAIRLNAKTYSVDARFVFENSGETQTVEVGFPEQGSGYYPEYQAKSYFDSFRTYVNDVPVKAEERIKIVAGYGEDAKTFSNRAEARQHCKAQKEMCHLSNQSWRVKSVTFPPGKTTTRVTYTAPYSYSSSATFAEYIFGTGRWWAGTIGRAEFDLQAASPDVQMIDAGIINDEHPMQFVKKRLSPRRMTIEMTDIEPENELESVSFRIATNKDDVAWFVEGENWMGVFIDEPVSANIEEFTARQAHRLWRGGYTERADCACPPPAPWFPEGHADARQAYFEKFSSYQAVETVILNSGANVLIANSGCDYCVVNVRWMVKASDLPKQSDWLANAATGLQTLATLQPAAFPFDVQAASQALSDALQSKIPITLDTELVFPSKRHPGQQDRLGLRKISYVLPEWAVVDMILHEIQPEP